MHLLSLSYWFNTRPEPFGGWLQIAFIILTLIFVAGSVASYLKNRQRELVYHKLWGNLFNYCLTNAILGLFLVFFNYEMVPVLMSKIWYAVWLVIILVWGYFIIRLARKLPQRKAELQKQKEFAKYLPK